MTTPLEGALREMLHERAGDIQDFPARLARLEDRTEVPIDEDLLDSRAARHSGWLLAAAVALIVAIAGAIVGIRQLSGHDTPPATPNSVAPTSTLTSTPTSAPTRPSASPSTSKSPAATDVPLACKATLPNAWRAALGSAPSAEGAQSATAMQVLPNGDVLVARDFGQGQPRDVAIISPGKAPRSIFTVPDPQLLDVQSAAISGNWLMVSVGERPRPRKGTIPGDSPMPNVVHLYVIDLRSGDQKQIASTTLLDGSKGGRTINLAVVLDGKVYWDVRSHYGSRTGVIKAYDLATGATNTAYSGAMDYLIASAAGIGATDSTHVYVHAALPPIVRDNLSARYPLSIATDGTAHAWEVLPHELAWWKPGLARPRYLHVTQPFGQGGFIVSGRYVVGGLIVDMTTGAEARYTAASPVPAPMSSYGTTVAGAEYVGGGHFQDGYWLDPQAELTQFDTGALPDLRC